MNIGTNIVWAAGEQCLRVALTFFINIAIARHLGPESYGTLGAVFAVAALLQCASNFGLDNICIRETATSGNHLGTITAEILIVRLSAGLLILVPAASWCVARRGDVFADALFCLSLLIPFQLAGTTAGNIFSGKLLSKFSTISLVISMILAGALRLYGITSGQNLIFFIECYIFEYLSATILVILCFCTIFKNQFGEWRPTVNGVRSLLSGARWLVLSALAVQFLQNAGMFFIAGSGTDQDLGNYAAAVRLISVTQFMPAMIGQSFIPAVIAAHDAQSPQLENYENQLFRCLALCGYLITGFCLTAGPWLLHLLLGTKFNGAIPAFMILAAGSIPLCMSAARAAIFSKRRNYKSILASDFTGALIIGISSVIFAPKYGAVGVATATVIGYFMAYLIVPYFLMKSEPETRRRLFEAFTWPFPNFRILFRKEESSKISF